MATDAFRTCRSERSKRLKPKRSSPGERTETVVASSGPRSSPRVRSAIVLPRADSKPVARVLGKDGYRLTVAARRPEKLESAVAGLRDEGIDVEAVPANMIDEQEVVRLVESHRERLGRLDVLINNAGIGIGGPIAEHETKKLDIELGVNLRAVYIVLRECIPMLKEAGAEHGKALVVNTSSIAGVHGEGWLGA